MATITTKFSVGDTVFSFENNIVREFKIDTIEIYQSEADNPEAKTPAPLRTDIWYKMDPDKGYGDKEEFREDNLFASKQAIAEHVQTEAKRIAELVLNS